MTDPNQLLREYAQSGSESAFRELVSRYVDLVHSVAVRRVGGDADLARDVVQTVFIDLARKASRLRSESSLGGWLHRHTCFVSSNFRRKQHRAAAREQIAMQINEANQTPDEAAWAQLAPVLDEAIDELGEDDRKAIVLRFYERRDLRSIGSALGTTDDAAQKRISRALEKLRDMLAARGTILGAGVITSLLTSRAISAAPVGLGVEIGSKALAAAGGTGLLGILLTMMTTWQMKLALGVAAAVLAAGVLVHTVGSHKEPPAHRAMRIAQTGTEAQGAPTTEPGGASAPDATPATENNATPINGPALHLVILAADSGQPVPNVQVNYRGRAEEHFARKQFLSNRSGECEVPLPPGLTDLELTSVADGFADTRLAWRPDRGETIPSSYTLRLIRPVRISGRVLDSDGQPITGAKVGWNCQEDGAAETRPESHNFGWIEVETGSDGRWQINRIAPDVLRRLYGSPTHLDYISPPLLTVSESPKAEQQLRDGSHVFRMNRAFSVSGTVLDADGQPLANASVYSAHIGESGRRETRSAVDGTFSLTGFKPGKNLISADAPGFAATTREIDVSANTPAVALQLQRGKKLILRLVDKAGQAIAGANVWYNTFGDMRVNPDRPTPPPPVQVEFDPTTDTEGRVVWTNAPLGELTFSFAKKGFMRQDDVKLTADADEHVITLNPALVVSGTVVDAATQQPIPKFRIACGWPSQGIGGTMQPRFSDIDRFWLDFAGGQFQHSFEEPLIGGMPSNPGYILKFQADGYTSFLSRVIKDDEGEVKLNVTLERASDLVLTILLPNGQPAAGIEIALVAPGRDLRLTPGGFSHWNGNSGEGLLTADAQGQVKLPSDDQVQSVVAASAAGFIQAPISAVRANPQLQLQPWGRIEGVYAAGSRAAERKMTLGPLQPGANGLQFDFQTFQVQTDAQGRFTFPTAPPGTWNLVRLVPESQGPRTVWRHEPIQQVDVRPGETLSLTVGAGTRTVSARFQLPDSFTLQPGMSLFASIHTPFPKPPAEIQNDQAALMKWGQSPDIRALAQKARGYQLHEDKDGSWSADEVPPGQYVVSVGIMSRQPSPNTKPLVAERSVTIPDGTDPMDLGELALQQAP